jgi:alpha-galactosidase
MDLEVNERQFPKGMKNLADELRALGFRPGLWTAPFGTGNTNFYLAHKQWFLHDAAGTPIKSWNGIFTLDPTVPEAREHLRKIHATAAHEWGYEFFKIDGMSGRNHGYCAHLY